MKTKLLLLALLALALPGLAQTTNLPSKFNTSGSAASNPHYLYVSATGTNATAQRGNVNRPWRHLYDYDGTNRIGAAAVATNGDTIFLIGTNRAGHVALNDGVTLKGYSSASALLFTNGMSFTNNVLLARGALGVGWPWIAVNGSATVENLFLDARDGTLSVTNATYSGASFISLFTSQIPSYQGNAINLQASHSGTYYIWVLNDTNNLRASYVLTAFASTNGTTNLVVRNCHLWGNQDVFFQVFQTNMVYLNGSTNDGSYSAEDFGTDGFGWSGATIAAMDWQTNVFSFAKPNIRVENCQLDGYWDHTFVAGGVKYTAIDVVAHSYGITNTANAYGQGLIMSGDCEVVDIGGTYYGAMATNENQTSAATISGGRAYLSGTRFYITNTTAPKFRWSNGGTISGVAIDGMSNNIVYLGGTNTYEIPVTNAVGNFWWED